MVKKNHVRKSTGGKAPRKELVKKTGSKVSTPALVDVEMSSADQIHSDGTPQSQVHCYVCLNGGDLYECNRCPRVLCIRHVVLPAGTDIKGTLFLCVACHLQVHSNPTPYRGFYRGTPTAPFSSWRPAFADTVKFEGIYQTTAKSQVLSDPLLVLNFVLSSIDPSGGPSRIVCEIMRGYLGDKLRVEDITFDIGSEELVEKHEHALGRLVRQLAKLKFSRVVVFVTDHSHDDTGDLYLSEEFSARVESFMEALFPEVLISFLKGKPTTLFMLACGALITNKESFKELIKSSGFIGIDNLIAFTAPEFHAILALSFFVDYTQRVLVEGFDVADSFKHILNGCSQSNLARHTNIVHVHFKDSLPSITKEYVFSHVKWRPWGYRIPSCCNLCSSPNSWADPVKSKSTYIFNCRKSGCRGVCSFDRPDGFDVLSGDVGGGRWLVRDYIVG